MPPPLILTKLVVKKKRNAEVKLAQAKMPPLKTTAEKASKKASKKSAPEGSKKVCEEIVTLVATQKQTPAGLSRQGLCKMDDDLLMP
jgi:hypothetical protein